MLTYKFAAHHSGCTPTPLNNRPTNQSALTPCAVYIIASSHIRFFDSLVFRLCTTPLPGVLKFLGPSGGRRETAGLLVVIDYHIQQMWHLLQTGYKDSNGGYEVKKKKFKGLKRVQRSK